MHASQIGDAVQFDVIRSDQELPSPAGEVRTEHCDYQAGMGALGEYSEKDQQSTGKIRIAWNIS